MKPYPEGLTQQHYMTPKGKRCPERATSDTLRAQGEREKEETMAKLVIERERARVEVDVDEGLCERLWKLEKEYWRGKRESSVESWRSLIPEVFDSFLKGKGY